MPVDVINFNEIRGDGKGYKRKLKTYVSRLKEKTRTIFVDIMQEVVTLFMRVQKRQCHVGKNQFIE